jgi:excinuclease UvrABC nuclease subunit
MEEQSVDVTAADSGLIALVPDNIDKLPEEPGVFLIVAPGQKVIYIGHAGDEGLRSSLWSFFEEHAIPAAAFFRYRTARDGSIAEVLAGDYINAMKPPYNVGYGRYRSSETSLTRGKRKIRQAAVNP